MNAQAIAISGELNKQPGISAYESMYDGQVGLRFDKKAHKYFVRYETVILNGREDMDMLHKEIPVPSVTQILGTLDKPALIYWAANCCVEVFKAKVLPGVAYDEIQLSEIAESIRKEFRQVSKKAKDIGTLVHEWIEQYVAAKGGPEVPKLPFNAAAQKCCTDAAAWMTAQGFTPSHTERRIYSRRHKYAGTLDAMSIAQIQGRPAIVDFKTSKAIYPEMRFQLAAYKQAVEEMTGERGFNRWIVRLPKEEGDSIEPVILPPKEYRADLRAFLGLKEAHNRLAQMKA